MMKRLRFRRKRRGRNGRYCGYRPHSDNADRYSQSRIERELRELDNLTCEEVEPGFHKDDDLKENDLQRKKSWQVNDDPIIADLEFDLPDTICDANESLGERLLVDDFSFVGGIRDQPIILLTDFEPSLHGKSSKEDSLDDCGLIPINPWLDKITKTSNKDNGGFLSNRLPTEINFPNSPTSIMRFVLGDQAETKTIDDKSLISYDEVTMIPSIEFFLRSEEELQNEGISIAENDMDDKSKMTCSKEYGGNQKFSDYIDDTKTKGYSVASTKYTIDSARVSELREKKRLMERKFESKYSTLPRTIEVSNIVKSL